MNNTLIYLTIGAFILFCLAIYLLARLFVKIKREEKGTYSNFLRSFKESRIVYSNSLDDWYKSKQSEYRSFKEIRRQKSNPSKPAIRKMFEVSTGYESSTSYN